jgi:hypothetical protein
MKQFILFVFLSCVIDAQSQGIENNIFTLSVPTLKLDNDVEGGYGGQIVFEKDSVMLYVAIDRLNVKTKEITLSYSILRQRDTVNIYPDFYTFEIERKGWQTDTLKNKVKYEKYLSDKDKIEKKLKELKEALDLIDVNDTEKIRKQNEKISEKQNELSLLAEVVPVYVYDDKFDDVVFIYVNNGLLTAAGREWVKSLPLHKKKPLAQYVN